MNEPQPTQRVSIDPAEFVAVKLIVLSLVSTFAHMLVRSGWTKEQVLDMIAEACETALPPQDTVAAEKLRLDAKAHVRALLATIANSAPSH